MKKNTAWVLVLTACLAAPSQAWWKHQVAGGGGGGLPLDSLSTAPTVAISFARKWRTAYAGPAFKVRATSTTQTDIGFTGANIVDTTALLAACPVDCWVVTAYDQSGNGRDFTQATTTKQPQIVSGHALLSPVNGYPAGTWVSGSITSLAAGVALSAIMSSTSYTILSSAHPTVGQTQTVDVTGQVLTDLTQGFLDHAAFSTSGGGTTVFNNFDTTNNTLSISTTYPSTHVFFQRLASTTQGAAMDGGTPITNTVGALGGMTGNPALGTVWNSARSMDGTISELVVWNSGAVSSADVNTVAGSMGTVAGTTWTNIP